MKRNWFSLLTVFLVFALLAIIFGREIFIFFGGSTHRCKPEDYSLSFPPEEVASVELSTICLESKQISDPEGIEMIVSRMNEIQICSSDNRWEEKLAAGSYGHTICFQMKDGSECSFCTIPLDEESMIFRDEKGIQHKIHSFDSHQLWDELDYEVQIG